MSLISEEMMKTIRATGDMEDEDMWVLGDSKVTFDERRRMLVVSERQENTWSIVGEVPVRAVRGRK